MQLQHVILCAFPLSMGLITLLRHDISDNMLLKFIIKVTKQVSLNSVKGLYTTTWKVLHRMKVLKVQYLATTKMLNPLDEKAKMKNPIK